MNPSLRPDEEYTLPPPIRDDVGDCMSTLPDDPETLLFPGSRSGEHMSAASLYKPWFQASENVGLPMLRWHDLRHFVGTTAAPTGGTLAEIPGRPGHCRVQAAMRYQHAVSGRDADCTVHRLVDQRRGQRLAHYLLDFQRVLPVVVVSVDQGASRPCIDADTVAREVPPVPTVVPVDELAARLAQAEAGALHSISKLRALRSVAMPGV